MEDRTIQDSQLSASSTYKNQAKYAPKQGRLRNNKHWSTKDAYRSGYHWIQVDFLSSGDAEVTGIQVQGSADSSSQEWVQKFKIEYGDAEDSLTFIMEGDVSKVKSAVPSKNASPYLKNKKKNIVDTFI